MGKAPIAPVEFAVIKEYIEVGGSNEGIAKVAGLTTYTVQEVRNAPHYKAYLDDLKAIHIKKMNRQMTKQESEWDKMRKKLLATTTPHKSKEGIE